MRTRSILSFASIVVLVVACGGGASNPSNGGDGGGSSGSGSGSGSGGTSGSGGSSSGGTDASASGSSGGDSGGSSSGADSGGSSSGSHDAGACGTCPNGFSCSASGYCVSTNGVPAFEHVFLIIMENTSESAIQGSAKAPYINSLMTTYAYTKNYSTSYHPSLPNYLDIVSGSNQGKTSDCAATACGGLTAQHLGDQLDGAQISWREYGEGGGGPCPINDDASTHYATKHMPFLFFQDISGTAATCQDRVVDYTQLATDLAAPRRFSQISPNLCDDMHDTCTGTNISQGDTWLSTEVPKILATPGFQSGGKDVLFIVWDEQTGSIGGSNIPMLCIPIGPLVKPGAVSTKAYTHESLLATFEEAFGVARLANAAQVPSPINDVWR